MINVEIQFRKHTGSPEKCLYLFTLLKSDL